LHGRNSGSKPRAVWNNAYPASVDPWSNPRDDSSKYWLGQLLELETNVDAFTDLTPGLSSTFQ
jgi:hypothetical protein